MKETEAGFCFRAPLPVCDLEGDVPLYRDTKRLKLCSSRVSSVYERIFNRNSRDLSGKEKSNNTTTHNGYSLGNLLPSVSLKAFSRPGDVCHYFLQSFVSNNRTYSQKMRQSSVFSSTPFNGHTKSSLKKNHISSERQIYQRLLDKASSFSRTPAGKPTNNLYGPITINLDEIKDNHCSLLRQCNLSPILPTNRIQPIDHHSTNDQTVSVPTSDTSDLKTRAWLESIAESPYLSDNWLNNLTSSYQAKKNEREREYELAKANIRFWEKQRASAEKERIDNLEQRLACLLRTPPILEDPYLVPQPIPIELPYKPVKVKEPKVPTLPVLTAPQLAQVEAALRTGSPDELLVDKFKLVVTRRELMTLTGTNWLSDMVINFYLQLLQRRSQHQTNLPRIAVLSTFFYAKLTAPIGGGYSGVRRWTRQIKLFDQDIILIPIHDRGMHWCLSCIDLRVKTITYYDSMGSGNMKCLNQLMDYLKNESLDKRNVELKDPDSWKLVNTEDTVPQQYNGSDCGVFLCTFGEFISRDASFTFSQDDMPGIRKRMMYEILTQQLLTTNFKLNDDDDDK